MGEGTRLANMGTSSVKPKRRTQWWLHHRPRPNMWAALGELSRYIATPRVAKYRLFVWLDARVCPDSATIAIARDDDTTLRHSAQPFPRGLVAPARHVARERQ